MPFLSSNQAAEKKKKWLYTAMQQNPTAAAQNS